MNSDAIRRVVETEIGSRWALTNAHHVDLRSNLVKPHLVECRNTFPVPDRPDPAVVKLWLVLEETPGSKEGYLILFNEKTGQFGLGDWGADGRPVFLGYHGSFWNTFEGM